MKKILITILTTVFTIGFVNAQECTAEIRKLGNASEGFLQAKFDPANAPDEIEVKGKGDVAPVRGSSGVWISSKKYTNTVVTLVLKKNGNTIKECSYDSNGNIKITQCFAEFISIEVDINASVSWIMNAEIDIKEYVVESSADGINNFIEEGKVAFNVSASGVYSFQDDNLQPFYRVKAVCNNGSDAAVSSVFETRR